MSYLKVHTSDLEKILDTLEQALNFHEHRDEMNAALHLSNPRYSPLTSSISESYARLRDTLDEINSERID